MNDTFKTALNRLQLYIVPSYESDNILLIFQNDDDKVNYLLNKKNKNQCIIDLIPITLNELINNPNRLDGLRYKRYWFVLDEENNND
jgi:hypothetical protein